MGLACPSVDLTYIPVVEMYVKSSKAQLTCFCFPEMYVVARVLGPRGHPPRPNSRSKRRAPPCPHMDAAALLGDVGLTSSYLELERRAAAYLPRYLAAAWAAKRPELQAQLDCEPGALFTS